MTLKNELKQLLARLKSDKGSEQIAAQLRLIEIGDPSVRALNVALESTSGRLAEEIITILHQIGSPSALQVIRSHIKNDNPNVALMANVIVDLPIPDLHQIDPDYLYRLNRDIEAAKGHTTGLEMQARTRNAITRLNWYIALHGEVVYSYILDYRGQLVHPKLADGLSLVDDKIAHNLLEYWRQGKRDPNGRNASQLMRYLLGRLQADSTPSTWIINSLRLVGDKTAVAPLTEASNRVQDNQLKKVIDSVIGVVDQY